MLFVRVARLMEKKFLQIMDRFFMILILLSGEEADENISINHIL